MTERELEAWGREVGRTATGQVTILLEGPLGAGKSVFARAVARGAGVEGDVPSPTYTLLNRHVGTGGRVVVHTDLYRIRDPDELLELGWEELGLDDELLLIEWPDRAGGDLPESRWVLRITVRADAPGVRDLEIERVGDPPDIPFPRAEERR